MRSEINIIGWFYGYCLWSIVRHMNLILYYKWNCETFSVGWIFCSVFFLFCFLVLCATLIRETNTSFGFLINNFVFFFFWFHSCHRLFLMIRRSFLFVSLFFIIIIIIIIDLVMVCILFAQFAYYIHSLCMNIIFCESLCFYGCFLYFMFFHLLFHFLFFLHTLLTTLGCVAQIILITTMCSMWYRTKFIRIGNACSRFGISRWLLLLHIMWHPFECWWYGSCTRRPSIL